MNAHKEWDGGPLSWCCATRPPGRQSLLPAPASRVRRPRGWWRDVSPPSRTPWSPRPCMTHFGADTPILPYQTLAEVNSVGVGTRVAAAGAARPATRKLRAGVASWADAYCRAKVSGGWPRTAARCWCKCGSFSDAHPRSCMAQSLLSIVVGVRLVHRNRAGGQAGMAHMSDKRLHQQISVAC